MVLSTELKANEEGVVWLVENEERLVLLHEINAGVMLRREALENWLEGGQKKCFGERGRLSSEINIFSKETVPTSPATEPVFSHHSLIPGFSRLLEPSLGARREQGQELCRQALQVMEQPPSVLLQGCPYLNIPQWLPLCLQPALLRLHWT